MNLKNLSLVVAFGITCGAVSVRAHEFVNGYLVIGHPWTYATPPGAKVGGAFMELRNKGAVGDKLISAETPIAGKTELHTHAIEGGVMRMRSVPGIEVAAGASVALKPGSFHVMLFDLKQGLIKGERFPLTLTFEKSGKTTVDVVVEDRGENAAHEHQGHKH
jgi:periplasmic copper chaperone A